MTYALSWALQEALFAAICADPVCSETFGHRIYDGPPPLSGDAETQGLYLTFGDEEANDWSTATDLGASHLVRLDVHAPRRSFAEAKRAAAALSDAILGADFQMSRGRVVNTRFVDARTRREEGDALRRIEMRFRIIVEDTV